MPLTRVDALMLQIAARDLRLVHAAGADGGVLPMVAALLDEVRRDISVPEPTPPRSLDPAGVVALLEAAKITPPGSTVEIERAALGFSKDTYIMGVASPDGLSERLVMRRDLPAGCTRTSVVDEFPLLVHLHGEGLPVPEPLLLESNPAILDGRFIIMRAAAGRPDVQTWEPDPHKRERLGTELASILARLHRLPLAGAPFSLPEGGPGIVLGDWLSGWRRQWEEIGRAEWAQVSRAYDYLEANLPDVERLVIVHADYGLHNIMVDDGRITAVLDWEFAHAGDPAEDLAYTQGRLEGFVHWERFLQDYIAAGGPSVPPERFGFYKIWRGVRNATCCAVGLAAFESGRNTDIRLAYAGRVLIHRYLGDLRFQMEGLGL